MFTIQKDAMGRYRISIGNGKPTSSKDLQGVVYALQHYFRESIPEYPYDYESHIKHAASCDCCPLCKS